MVEKWDPAPVHSGLVGLMVEHTPDAVFAEKKGKLFSMYAKSISSSKTALPAYQLVCVCVTGLWA